MRFAIVSLAFALFALPVSSHPSAPGDGPKEWTIEAGDAVYSVSPDGNGTVKSDWFGPAQGFRPGGSHLGDEVPVRGGLVGNLACVEVVFPDAVRDIELVFVKAGVTEAGGCRTLAIEQKDRHYPLTVISYIRAIPESGVFEKWTELRNDGKKSVTVENLQSGGFFLPRGEYDLTTLPGYWGSEFVPETAPLTTGTKTIEVRDFKSYGSSYFAVNPRGDADRVWFGMVNYSGNWRVDFNKRFNAGLQVSGGINHWDSSWELKGGAVLSTPKIVIGYTGEGVEGAAGRLSSYVRSHLLPAHKSDRLRPVLYNSWYATTFNINIEQQLVLARAAKEIGVEVFVVDDGWFKGRVDDKHGLGDWTVDLERFPQGLEPLISEVNELGMDFGIWVEPEMVNPNSDLFRKHPDWILHFPNREQSLSRNQAVLNLAREDVYQYLLKSMTDLLANNNIKYLKWDHNRPISQPGWPGETPARQREVRMRYMDNLYRLIGELTAHFPEVWFENCSSGGGRVDGGMLSLADMCWTSDNTDAVDRQFIQYGYMSAFPANTMICWVTEEDWHQLGLSLEYKFDVSMQGVLGIGENIGKWDAHEKETAAKKIALYKDIRWIVQNGTPHRLISPYTGGRTALQYMSGSGAEGVLMMYNRQADIPMVTEGGRASQKMKLQGLQPDETYSVEGYGGTYKGAYLMETGLDWTVYGGYTSRILKIERK